LFLFFVPFLFLLYFYFYFCSIFIFTSFLFLFYSFISIFLAVFISFKIENLRIDLQNLIQNPFHFFHFKINIFSKSQIPPPLILILSKRILSERQRTKNRKFAD